MRSRFLVVLTFAGALGCPGVGAADWPQLAHNPQHTGYCREKLKPPFTIKWVVSFPPERLYPSIQPAVVEGLAFLGTESGNLYALKAGDGKQAWKFPEGADNHVGAIMGTAGVEGGKVFFASMDGCVYALEAQTGRPAWKFDAETRTGFSTSVVLAEGLVFAPNRGGTFFAISQSDGKPAWKAEFDCALLQAPAYHDGRVYVAGMDMRLYALEARTGKPVWKTQPIQGTALKDYWPLVYKGLVLVRPMGHFEASCFKEDTGEPVDLRIPIGWAMDGAVAPPCVDAEGKIVVHKGPNHPSRWARMDVDTKEVEVISKINVDGARGGYGNKDENVIASAAGDLIFLIHTACGIHAQFNGCYDLSTKTWTAIRGPLAYHQMTSNTQGGGAGQAVAAGGLLFVATRNKLVCFEGGR